MTSPRPDLADMIAGLLHDWLPHQRWFGGKQREISDVRPVQWRTLVDRGPDGPRLDQLVVAVAQNSGRGLEEELYQLLIGVRPVLPERLEYARIGGFDIEGTHLVAYDASFDGELMAAILELINHDAEVDGVRFQREDGPLNTKVVSRPIIAEQSNTSVIFSDEYILKLFRKVHRGLSPDVELHRALRQVGSQHIADPFGTIEGELDGEPVSYGILQRYFANCADGWVMALTSVRDLIAEADLHADEVGGDFAAESRRLGQAVAAVHADLAKALGTELVRVDEVHTVVDRMNARLDAVIERVADLAPYRDAIRSVFAQITELGTPVRIQRIHGDLHLGQALRTILHWVIIDFEGEPARPLAERVRRMTPLRDVAGMLRSFDYAAHHLLVDYMPGETYESESQLEYRAMEWAERNRAAFCDGYATGGVDPRDQPVLLRALELEKAVYEVAYEHANRPSWIDIPLRSIARLTRDATV